MLDLAATSGMAQASQPRGRGAYDCVHGDYHAEDSQKFDQRRGTLMMQTEGDERIFLILAFVKPPFVVQLVAHLGLLDGVPYAGGSLTDRLFHRYLLYHATIP